MATGGPSHFQGAQILKSVMGNALLQITKHEPCMNNAWQKNANVIILSHYPWTPVSQPPLTTVINLSNRQLIKQNCFRRAAPLGHGDVSSAKQHYTSCSCMLATHSECACQPCFRRMAHSTGGGGALAKYMKDAIGNMLSTYGHIRSLVWIHKQWPLKQGNTICVRVRKKERMERKMSTMP